jgi:hypothetical protein
VTRALALAALLFGTEPAPAKSSLELLANQIQAEVSAERPESPVAVAVQAQSAALADSLAALVAARLTGAGLAAFTLPPGADVAQRARSQGARSLLGLQLQLDDRLAASGSLRSVWRNFWAGKVPVEAGPARALSAVVPADTAARVLAAGGGWPSGLALEPAPLARFAARTAALASGDLDGDGRPEVAVLVGGELLVIASTGEPRAHARLPAPTVPLREPFGTVCVAGGVVSVAWARAAGGTAYRLQGQELVPVARTEGPTLGCGESAEPASFVPGVARMLVGRGPQRDLVWGGDVRAGHRLLLFPDGTARWSTPGGTVRVLQQIGAGAALVQLGGEMRVAASTAAAAPAEDRLRLVGSGGSEPSVAVPGRILQVEPTAELAGAPALVLGVWTADGGSELRIVREGR